MDLQEFIDAEFPPGTVRRIQFDKMVERHRRKDNLIDRAFGWMRHIPPHLGHKVDDFGYDERYWYGLGPLMYMFWATLVDEGFYGTLDMLAFHYFDDKYVPTIADIRQRKGRKAR